MEKEANFIEQKFDEKLKGNGMTATINVEGNIFKFKDMYKGHYQIFDLKDNPIIEITVFNDKALAFSD